ncbi:hypothetical protein LUZ63_015207 [Rhynchospora breviuscula]|uniref:Myb/SANT-like domain-containing protein n=1 Tax=Rhynchospora breviuscula TaxID=2022672 RepID=A0A9Q0CBW7_9POAL|nr:hypothetical protein LUZ63_015207 [Rhynchospora breviuscula]
MESDASNEEKLDEILSSEKALEGGYFAWTKTMDTALLEVLHEQQLKGLKDDRTFHAEAYRVAIESLNAKFHIKITREKVLNRLKTLKDTMNLAIQALKNSGFTWNDSTKKIQAGPQVWDDLIKANPKMRRIRDKEISNLDLLRDIFEPDRANGVKGNTPKERPQQWKDSAMTIDEVDQLQADNVVVLDNFENLTADNQNGASSSTKSMKKFSSKLGVKRKAEEAESKGIDSRSVLNKFDEGIMIMKESMSGIAQQLAIGNEYFMKSNMRVYSGAEIYAELQRIGVTNGKMIRATRLLKADKEEMDNFFAWPDELKREWLQEKGIDCWSFMD